MTMRPGTVVAERFVIERRAGAGGMGTVHRALDVHTGAKVAVKVIHGRADEDVERFLREVGAIASITHPGIVRYVDHGVTEEGALFVAMQWLSGETLSERLARGRLGSHETVTLLWRLADALEAAHDRGIVHRDLKPANVFLPEGALEEAVLVDFGIARSLGASSSLTGELAIGTPGYMAPEQARARPDVDARADLFSLGCVAYRCLTGRRPFVGDDMLAVLTRLVFEEPARPRDLEPSIPPALEALVVRLLAKDPAERPEDAARVKAMLSELPDHEGSVAPAEAIGHAEEVVVSVVLHRGKGIDEGAFTRLRLWCATHGAALEQLADGTLVAAFAPSPGGGPDGTLLAARCARAMRAELAEGPMVLAMGKGVTGSRLPFGEAIDCGVEILRAAPEEPCIVLDEEAARVLSGAFTIDAQRSPPRLGTEQTSLAVGAGVPFIGRERELASLAASYAECVAEKMARGVLVSGPTGIGKSRLVFELLARLEPSPTIWTSRCDPALVAAPYRTLGRALLGAAAISESEPIAMRRRKLVEWVRARTSEQVGADLVPLLGEMAGVSFPDASSPLLLAARRDGAAHREAMRSAWQRFVELSAGHCPLVLVVEDLQWSDAPSIALLERTLRQSLPVLVIATARPDLYDRFPRLWREASSEELRLGPLPRRLALELAQSILGAQSEARAAAIVDRSGQNPMFLVELLRAAAAGRAALPDGVLASVQERLLDLAPELRRVLRAVSVFGSEVSREAVAALLSDLSPRALDDHLRALSEAEILEGASRGMIAFRHLLLREAAYAMLPEGDRRRAHGLAARWLAEHDGDPLLVGDHYEHAGASAEAARQLTRGAERALAALDLEGAKAVTARALGLGVGGEARAELLLIEGEIALWRARFSEAGALAFEVLESCEPGSALWHKAAAGAIYLGGQLGEIDRVAALLTRLEREPSRGGPLERIAWAQAVWWLATVGRVTAARSFLERIAAAETPADDAIAQAWSWWARFYGAMLTSGDLPLALESAERAEEAFERAGLSNHRESTRAHRAWALAELGDLERAASILTRAVTLARDSGAALFFCFSAWQLAEVALRQGEIDAATALADEAATRAHELGLTRLEGLARATSARGWQERGDLERATRGAEQASALLASAPPFGAPALARLIRLRIAAGRLEEAEALSLSVAGEMAEATPSGGGLKLARAALWLAKGRLEEARSAIGEVEADLVACAARLADPGLRERYLERHPLRGELEALRADLG